MYYKNTSNNNRSNQSNVFVNKFLNNRNNQDNEKNITAQASMSNLSSIGRLNKNNHSSVDLIEAQPYKKVNKGTPLNIKTKGNAIASESNSIMNSSFDNTLKDTKKFNVEDENELTFGKSYKKHQRTASMENTTVDYDKLICNNCLNTQLNTVRKLKNKDDDKFLGKEDENNNSFDNMNKSRAKLKEQKIKNREELSMLAAQGVKQGNITEKEALQRSCENQEFGLFKGSMESAKKRVMEKNYINESVNKKIADKFLNSIKTEKDRNESIKPFTSSIGSTYKETNKQDYMRELRQQSQKRELLDEKINMIDRNKAMESVLYYKNKSELAEKERQEKEKKMKQEFLEENNKLIEKKNRKKLITKHMESQVDRELIIKSNNDLEKEKNETILKKNQVSNDLNTVLKAQINHKNKNRSQSQGPVEQSLLICKNNECKYPCSKCNNKYPLKMLNSKDIVFGKGKINYNIIN